MSIWIIIAIGGAVAGGLAAYALYRFDKHRRHSDFLDWLDNGDCATCDGGGCRDCT